MTMRMNWNDLFKNPKAPFFVAGLLFSIWFLPPVIHQSLHRCPVYHPDGVNSAEALPAYARKYGMSCNQCHTSWPLLNAYGRQFKLNGYVRTPGSEEGVQQSQDQSLWFEKMVPWALIVRSRPYDKSTINDSEFKMQAVRDVDMFIAGGDAAKRISWLGEIDANADTTPSYSLNAGDLQLGYHPSPYLSVIAARRGFFVVDPYQTLSNFGSPTIGNRAIAGGQTDQGSLSKDTLDETKQTLAAYGRASQSGWGNAYYAIGVSADKGDDAGRGPKDGNIRLALSTPQDHFMIGTFGVSGAEGPAATGSNKVQFSKTGVDTMAEIAGFTARGAFEYAYDHDEATDLREVNRAAYAELLYVFNCKESDTPFLVPLVRGNWYTTANGTRQFSYLTAQLAHYFKPNAKAFIEWSGDTKQDVTTASGTRHAPKDSRWTLQGEVGF